MEPINKLIKKIEVGKSDLPKLNKQIKSRNAPINKFKTSFPSIKSLANKKIISTNANRDRAMQRYISLNNKGLRSLDATDRFSNKIDVQEKVNKQRSYNRKVLAGKVIKNMGKLSPVGLVTAIMQPKKVGDATLKKNINRNPNFPR